MDVRRIYDALLEGRALWHRVRDAVAILVGGNAGEVAFMVLGTALAGRAPIGVRQMLLVNMLTDMFPALAVAVAPNGDDGPAPESRPADGLGAPLARAVRCAASATALGALAGLDDRPVHRPAAPGEQHGPRRARRHPARPDAADRLAQPARRRHGLASAAVLVADRRDARESATSSAARRSDPWPGAW